MQLDDAKALVAERGWELTGVFEDRGETGGAPLRAGLHAVRSAARSGTLDVLVVWRMDRLFRSLIDMLVIVDELLAHGVQVVSCTEPIDLTTATGRLHLKLAAAFAEYEREVARERTCSGVAAARRRGARLGRPRRVFDIERARALIAAGRPLREAANVVGVGYGTLRRALASSQ